MADSTWLILLQQGVVVEEADEDEGDEGGGLGTEDKVDEKDVLAEKIALHLQAIGIGGGVDVTNLEGHDDRIGKEIRLGRSELDSHALR